MLSRDVTLLTDASLPRESMASSPSAKIQSFVGFEPRTRRLQSFVAVTRT